MLKIFLLSHSLPIDDGSNAANTTCTYEALHLVKADAVVRRQQHNRLNWQHFNFYYPPYQPFMDSSTNSSHPWLLPREQ